MCALTHAADSKGSPTNTRVRTVCGVQLMDKQRQGMEHLTNIINDDLADIQLIKETWRR